MGSKIPIQRRREIEREANEIRLDCIRRGLAPEEIADRIMRTVRDVFPLEAWRFAHGWTRTEVSARLDALYEADGLAAPHLSASELCRWELADRRPSEERIEYFCRLYRTRPDRLGYGTDHTPGEISHLQRTGIIDAYPYTSQESEQDLLDRIQGARERISMFGLSRNFYARDEVLPILQEKAASVPIQIFVMDPYCASRKDRYRIEPADAAMEDPERYIREALRPLHRVAQMQPGFRLYTFNFPCSYAIEEVDDVCRVMMYGHGTRGTHGPIIMFGHGTPAHTHFVDQIRWLERLAGGDTPEPWASKGIEVRPVRDL